MKIQGEKTRHNILNVGLTLYPDVTDTSIAKVLKITRPAVSYHFPDIKKAVCEYALKTNYSPVIVQMILDKDPLIKDMSKSQRLKHFIKCLNP